MITVEDAVNRLYNELYNIGFSVPPYEEEVTGRYYILDSRVFSSALDRLQELCDICTKTDDAEFNKLTHKVLGTVAAFLYYYYKGGTRKIERVMYFAKVLLDIRSLYHCADFFKNRYIHGSDCYLVFMENRSKEALQFQDRTYSKQYDDVYMFMPLRLFKRGEPIMVKRVNDERYTYIPYNPNELISTLVFSVENEKICCRVDNSKWLDSAWGL